MKSPIAYYIKSTYGNDRMYVSDPVIAQAIATLTGDKTLSFKAISALECLGHRFQQVLPPGARPNYGKTALPHVTPIDFAALADSICHAPYRSENR